MQLKEFSRNAVILKINQFGIDLDSIWDRFSAAESFVPGLSENTNAPDSFSATSSFIAVPLREVSFGYPGTNVAVVLSAMTTVGPCQSVGLITITFVACGPCLALYMPIHFCLVRPLMKCAEKVVTPCGMGLVRSLESCGLVEFEGSTCPTALPMRTPRW